MTSILMMVDDESSFELVGDYLRKKDFSVHFEKDEASTFAQAMSKNYEIVVVDMVAAGTNGVELLRRIRSNTALPVIFLRSRENMVDCAIGLDLGADDCVTKPCDPRELVARIRAVLRRTKQDRTVHRSADHIQSGKLVMWPKQRRVEWGGKSLVFTSTQFNLLEMLLLHVGRPVSKHDLSAHALGRPHALHDRSIDMHLSCIRRKLGTLADGRSLIQTVHRRGYQLLEE